MYIWMILATFMVLLYSYNLSVRGDMREVKIEPQAEVVVSQLVVQQRAGQEYIRWLASPLNETGMSYLEEKLDCDTTLKNFLPYGYNCDGSFTTEVYCLRKDNWDQGIADCSSPDALKYLITYGYIPPKWLNLSSNTPTNDLLKAAQNVLGMDTSFGYAVHLDASDPASGGHSGDKNYKMAVKGREDTMVYIPNYVVDNGNFSTACACANCNRCLVYVTPFE